MAKSEADPQRPNLSKPQAPQVFKDPVCGMEVSTHKSYSATHRDQEFRFCSLSCLEKFKADPEAFVQR
jgi:P-type Cu+ transporter